MDERSCVAAILDMDGVVTRTASGHARAWKQAFDAFLERLEPEPAQNRVPFDIDADYRRYVDGKPRYAGIRSFLESRGIRLPEGDPEDGPEADTVYGLGRRKNEIFLEMLRREGVAPHPDAVEQVRRWRERGVPVALITSSRNGEAIVDAAGVRDLFDTIIDGVVAERIGLRGKPAPDVFAEAARRLGVDPREALVIEDAIAGVEAARAGGFGCVAGVARNGGDELREHGADVVVRDIRELDPLVRSRSRPGPALNRFGEIVERIGGRSLALFLDYDGTLTPIVRRPEEATLDDEMRGRLTNLAELAFVAIVSGRDLDDVRSRVGLENLYYAGSHGFDIAGPEGFRVQQESARERLTELKAAEHRLRQELEGKVDGAWVERKQFALAIHFREAPEEDEPGIEEVVDRIRSEHPALRKKGGKKIFELQPDVPWDKGRAVLFLLERLGLASNDVAPAYIGDDLTDEDAFEALKGTGITIRVGSPAEPTRAEYFVSDTEELKLFLTRLTERLEVEGTARG